MNVTIDPQALPYVIAVRARLRGMPATLRTSQLLVDLGAMRQSLGALRTRSPASSPSGW